MKKSKMTGEYAGYEYTAKAEKKKKDTSTSDKRVGGDLRTGKSR